MRVVAIRDADANGWVAPAERQVRVGGGNIQTGFDAQVQTGHCWPAQPEDDWAAADRPAACRSVRSEPCIPGRCTDSQICLDLVDQGGQGRSVLRTQVKLQPGVGRDGIYEVPPWITPTFRVVQGDLGSESLVMRIDQLANFVDGRRLAVIHPGMSARGMHTDFVAFNTQPAMKDRAQAHTFDNQVSQRACAKTIDDRLDSAQIPQALLPPH